MNPNIAEKTNLFSFPQTGLDAAIIAAFDSIRQRGFEPFAVFGVSSSERIARRIAVGGEAIDMGGHTSDALLRCRDFPKNKFYKLPPFIK